MGATKLGAAAVLLSLWMTGCHSDEPRSTETSSRSPSPIATATEVAPPPYVGRVVPMHGEPSEIILAFGSLWVVSHRAATVTRIDPATGEVQARVSSPRGHLVGVAASRGHVWFLSSDAQTVDAIDATSNELDISVPVHSDGGGLAAAPDGVWFAGTSGRAVHIRAGKIVRSVRIATEGTYLTPWLVGRRLFVADGDNGRLTLLDVATARVVRTFDIGGDVAVFTSPATRCGSALGRARCGASTRVPAPFRTRSRPTRSITWPCAASGCGCGSPPRRSSVSTR
jgi:hypothetical protein